MSTQQFQRCIEDFVCEHCGTVVTGNGYTNHCPQCLWSKHVDIQPGDRLSHCRGLMQPIAVSSCQGRKITHRCERCGHEKRNKAQKEDNFDALLQVMRGT